MLVLNRFVGQTIVVGDDIEITVVKIDGAKIAIGIEAPRCIAVNRKEIYKGKINHTTSTIPSNETIRGTITAINESSGYGFIYSPGVESSIFFHASDVLMSEFDSLTEGSDVEFKVARSKKGMVATDVKSHCCNT